MNERDALIGQELMDRPDANPAELERSLVDLRAVNRWLGGTRSMLRMFARAVTRIGARPVRVLDVGTGSADIPLELSRWGRSHGVELRITATDLHPRTVEVAGERVAGDPWISVEAADALSLPYEDARFHVALCSTALHHFTGAGALQVLRELSRVRSSALLVGDLRRSALGLWGARLLAATVWRSHPITRHDGPISVRSAFTTKELLALAEEAGLQGAEVRAEPVFRLSLFHQHRAGGG